MTAKREMKGYYRDLFNGIPEYWDDIYETDSFYGNHYRRRKEEIYGLLRGQRFEKNAKILDVGCGAGGYFPMMFNLGFSVTGVDAAEAMIDRIGGIYPQQIQSGQLSASVGDVEKLDFPDNAFDAANCAGVLMYLPTIEGAVSEIFRVLKPGGVATLNTDNHRTISMLFDLPNLASVIKRKVSSRGSIPNSSSADEQSKESADGDIVTKTYSPMQFRKMVESCGFRIEAESGHGFDRIKFNNKPAFSDRMNKLIYQALDPAFSIRAVARTGMTYTVLARKPNDENT